MASKVESSLQPNSHYEMAYVKFNSNFCCLPSYEGDEKWHYKQADNYHMKKQFCNYLGKNTQKINYKWHNFFSLKSMVKIYF